MAKLWQKSYSLDAMMEAFTVGNDPVLDLALVNADCVASMAHAAMLQSIGILSATDGRALHTALAQIIKDHKAGGFPIRREDEDVHTAIENALVKAVGEAGKGSTPAGRATTRSSRLCGSGRAGTCSRS